MHIPFFTARFRREDAAARAAFPAVAAAPVATSATEAKASRAGPLIAFQSHGQPRWTPRDYAALAREGFARNAIVYRCVRMIAEASASVPWLLYEGETELTEHPLLDLLARPNRSQAGADFREALAGHLLTAGNAYIEAVALAADASGAASVRELHVLRPDRMKVVPGGDGWPEAYEYTVAGRSVRFPVTADPGSMAGAGPLPPILHLSLFHPLDDHYGFAPVEAAAVALDLHNAAGAWNKALLDNSARPSGALVYTAKDGGNLSAEQYERLKGELEQGFTGAARAGRPLLLEGGLDWKAMALTPKDMDFLEAKNGAAREIALAFGVPPMLLGIPGDNTYANYREANAAFWRGTVLPLVARIAGAIGNWLAPAFGDPGWGAGTSRGTGLRLWFDADQVDALSADREALWLRVAAADFLTVNEKRAAVGYAPVAGGDEIKSESDGLELRYNPHWEQQPRVPRGHIDGGRWTDGGATGGGRQTIPASTGGGADTSDARPVHLASNDWLPKIPVTRPTSQSARWMIVKDIVRGMARASPLGRLIDVIEIGSWLYEYAPYVQAYFDSPKTLAELRAVVGTPVRGYDVHHIVERTPALADRLDPARVDGPENLVRIPTLKHWEITGWYGTRNDDYGGLTPRVYLRGKDFDTRFRVGEFALRKYGVLKP